MFVTLRPISCDPSQPCVFPMDREGCQREGFKIVRHSAAVFTWPLSTMRFSNGSWRLSTRGLLIWLSLSPYVYTFIYIYIESYIYVSMDLYISMSLSLYLSISIPINIVISISIYMSISTSISLLSPTIYIHVIYVVMSHILTYLYISISLHISILPYLCISISCLYL